MSPADAWRALAAGVAGGDRVRVSRDGGRTYRARYERAISDELPNQPAAVLIYDHTGAAKTFCIDLDTQRAGAAGVETDYAALTALLQRCGARWFADESPNGGRHIYVPLAEPLPFHDAAATARALATRTPSMDPMPMLGIESGCIRPPGARHRSGGHQRLLGTLSDAYDALRRPTSPQAWARLVDDVAPAGLSPVVDVAPDLVDEQLPSLGRHRAPDDRYQEIARTGLYDAARYASPSEARQAVIWAAVAAGWAFRDVARRVTDGTWPGLAAMYGRYRSGSRHGALVRDWKNAVAFEKRRRQNPGSDSVRVRPTRGLETHRGHPYGKVRSWLNAVDLTWNQNRRDHLATRAVLYALAEAAHRTGDLEVEFGNRALAVATGLDHRTVGRSLNRLADDPEPLIQLVAPAHGVAATRWRLVIPPAHVDAAEHISWRRGRIRGIRPVFRELGLAAAYVYGALERQHSPIGGRDLANDAGLGVTATYEALDTLAAWGLAQRAAGGWIVGTASVDALAEQLGISDAVRAQLERYRAERLAYWAVLGIVRLSGPAGSVGTYQSTNAPPPDLEPPPPGETLMDLLERELGAHIIATEAAS